MAPTLRRKPAQKAKSKLLANDKLAGPSVTSTNEPPKLKRSGSLLENIPICMTQTAKGKGKGKQKEIIAVVEDCTVDADDQLWTDKYAPQNESELAIHKKKVDEVRHWLKEAFEGGANGTLQRFRRILALTGPAGTGKTATLKVLAQELVFDIVEWHNTVDDRFAGDGEDYDYESLVSKFRSFLNRASSCRALNLSSTSSSTQDNKLQQKQIILLEDLPNILHHDTAMAFHAALEDFVSQDNRIPLICIISDSGLRGEDQESGVSTRQYGRGQWDKQVVDVRSVIPSSVSSSIYFREIRFNPIAPTIMTKALTMLVAKHFDSASSRKNTKKPGKEVIQLLVESSNGDIRSAIMALQFACVMQVSSPKAGGKGNARAVLEAVTRREQSLVLFHLLGKVLYNKRKGDPESSSSTAKEREKLQQEDKRLKDPPALPDHLSYHTRRASRVDVNALYADSPIDSSMFALYLHQNYSQFCEDIDQCDAVAEQMSWTDTVFPELTQSINAPYQFHLLALNTLHYLPSPVPRLSQKLYKPAFFDNLKEMREAEDGVADTEGWLNGFVEIEAELDPEQDINTGRRWKRSEIVLEFGGVLKAFEKQESPPFLPPRTHGKFSSMTFVHPSRIMQKPTMNQLDEDQGLEIPPIPSQSQTLFPSRLPGKVPEDTKSNSKGWLETDDITEF